MCWLLNMEAQEARRESGQDTDVATVTILFRIEEGGHHFSSTYAQIRIESEALDGV